MFEEPSFIASHFSEGLSYLDTVKGGPSVRRALKNEDILAFVGHSPLEKEC